MFGCARPASTQRAIAGLARFGSVRTEDGWLTIDGLDGEGVPALVTEIVSRGGRVYAVEPRQTTLEDRFLQLVEPLGGSDVTTILRLTVREAVRRRLVWALFVMTLLVVAVTGWGFQRFVEVAHQRGLLDVEIRLAVSQLLILVAFMFSFVLAMTAVFFGAPAVAADVESGLMLGVLSRPIRRADLLLGKWLGLAVLVVGYAVLSGAVEMAVTAALTGWVPPDPLAAVALPGMRGRRADDARVAPEHADVGRDRRRRRGGPVRARLAGRHPGQVRSGAAHRRADRRPAPSASSSCRATRCGGALPRASKRPRPSLRQRAGGQGANGFDEVFTGSAPTAAELAWVVVWVAVLLTAAVRLFRNRDL